METDFDDLTPTDPIANNINDMLADEVTEASQRQSLEQTSSKTHNVEPQLNNKKEQCTVEVHLHNGDTTKNIDSEEVTVEVNGHMSDDNRSNTVEDDDEDDVSTDTNHNYKQPLLVDQLKNVQNHPVSRSPSPIKRRSKNNHLLILIKKFRRKDYIKTLTCLIISC